MRTVVLGATLYESKNHVEFKIPKKLIRLDDVAELDNLKQENPLYMAVSEIKDNKNNIVICYEKEEGYQNLNSVRKSNMVLKLSLINEVLKANPMNDIEHPTILHPHNIFFKDLHHIKLLYRANNISLQEETMSAFEQYKLFTLVMLTGQSYEVMKNTKKKYRILGKEKNDFYNSVERTENLEELHKLIIEELDKQETDYFIQEENRVINNKAKIRHSRIVAYVIAMFTMIMTIVIGAGCVVKAERNFNDKLSVYQNREYAYKSLLYGNPEEAEGYLGKASFSETEMYDWLFMSGQYTALLEQRSDLSVFVVENLYRMGKQNEILNIQAAEENAFIKVEQAILNNDIAYLKATYTNVEDIRQQEAILEQFKAAGLTDYVNSLVSIMEQTAALEDSNNENGK